MVIFFMNKKYAIINVFLTFIMGFVVHGLYQWFPSIVTSIFPVNESLYEHIKLIFYSPVIASTILYFIFKYKGKKINNFLFGLFTSTIFNIFIFYLVYLPIYKMMGANLLVTLIIYFITIGISQYLNYLIINTKVNYKALNLVSLILLFISVVVLTYFTYNPMKNDFFKDPENNSYGIKK